ncbi:MAG: polysaccharide biosynthesis/export family protein [Rhodomicrobium sp.]|jgi:polysaccharide export outer membrane protein
MKSMLRCGASILALVSGACSQLPDTGPAYRDIFHAAATTATAPVEGVEYALVDLTPLVVEHAADIGPGSFFKTLGRGKGPAPEIAVGRGDVVQLTVFESKPGGLFIPAEASVRPGNFVQLAPQQVSHDGSIEVPYAGRLQAAGRSLDQIQADIEQRLQNRAIEPKVIAALVEQNATAVSVVGEVNQPRKIRITQNGERILDMIALAGGIRFPGYETYVTLQRGDRKATVYFNALVSHPEENIYTKPGDVIYIYREPSRFVVAGAVASSTPSGNVSQQFDFGQEHVSLTEGLAKAGGLLDDHANPAMIFVYRVEPREVLQSMGVDVSCFPPAQAFIPTIYRANFRNPSTYFLAQRFPLRNRDVLFVSNADAIEVAKFLNYTRLITSTASGVTLDAAVARASGTYIGRGSANAAPQ